VAGRLRVAIDATPLLGARTGVGRVTEELVERIGRDPDVDLVAFAVTWRGRRALPGAVGPDARVVRRPMAARPLRMAWTRADQPPIEWWTGAVDVVHGPNYVVPPARHAAEVVSVHDLTFLHHPELCTADTLAYPPLIRRAVHRGALVHTGSHAVAAEIEADLGVPADQIVVVPYGVTPAPDDPDGRARAAGRALAGAERFVLALGTIEPRKDLPTLVKAFDLLADERSDVTLVIAGPDGWGADALTEVIAASPHRARVRRLGFVAEVDRLALLRGASVYAYPSVYEGFGLPPLEAMSVGTPVVTTRAGSLPEVVGEAAAVVDPGDTEALATAIADLLDHPDRAADLGRRGVHRAAAFPWEATASGLLDAYRRGADLHSRT
jgi:glycosyltransferase involved in cell wall biosynthesis